MKIIINGKEVNAKEVGFSTIGESWNTYQLEDGKTVRVKCVLVNVRETDERGPDGKPIYSFNAQPIFAVDEQ